MGPVSAARQASDENVAVSLLAIDDDAQNVGLISEALADSQVEILTATDAETGLDLFRRNRPQIVLLDLVMPKINGMELLEKMVEIDPAADIILMTGHYSTDSAVEAIQKGASDYLTKPLDIHKLRSRVEGIVAEAERRHRTVQLEYKLLEACEFQGIIGRSPLMLNVFATIRRVAPHFRTVLVSGATGTGKELVAKALHRLSPVAGKAFAVCDCSALVEGLIESELFGYVRGAFTGATHDKTGIFEYANGGTVFLDEIGELPMSSQAKLLRVLQNREIQRVGSPIQHHIDVRVVAATNRDLRTFVQEGKFREDLYYRLAMVEIPLPRLAERKEDLLLLQRYFLRRFAEQYKKEITGMTRRAQALLVRYSWPGNVRELENVIGNACMMASGTVIDVQDLSETLRNPNSAAFSEEGQLPSMEEVQKRHLTNVLSQVNGNKSQAAEILGVSRATVYEMLARMKIEEKESQAK